MELPPQARVLRCCSCRLFQAHQVKKSLKWTCKACGEKQSFLRAYGEGSGADCRRHVQKLNLLQGQASEMPHRSLEEAASAGREGSMGPGPAEHEHVHVQDCTGQAGQDTEGGLCEYQEPRAHPGAGGDPRCAVQPARATASKWERFLTPPGSSSHVDLEPLMGSRPAGAAQAEQGTSRAQTARERDLSSSVGALQLPWATHSSVHGLERQTSEWWLGTSPQAEGGPVARGVQQSHLQRLCDLFCTGEDLDDIL